MRHIRFNKRQGVVIVLWMLVLFTLAMATFPKPPALPGIPPGEAEHILAFATLTLLATIAYPNAKPVAVFAWLAAFGALIEVIQAIPWLHRDPDILDWITDCCTILIVLCAIWQLRRRFRTDESAVAASRPPD